LISGFGRGGVEKGMGGMVETGMGGG